MKKLVISICVGFLLALGLHAFAQNTETALSQGLIRLHVRANSNSGADQKLKLKVRDRILAQGSEMSLKQRDIADVREYIASNLDLIAQIAQDEVQKNGFNYPVRVRLGKGEFPLKTYGDMTLPAGTYEALTVEIGRGEGKNWWCVMFPPLCFTEETFAALPEESEEILIENLGDDTYSMLKSGKLQVKFKLYEIIKKTFR